MSIDIAAAFADGTGMPSLSVIIPSAIFLFCIVFFSGGALIALNHELRRSEADKGELIKNILSIFLGIILVFAFFSMLSI